MGVTMTLSRSTFSYDGGGVVRSSVISSRSSSIAVGGTTMQGAFSLVYKNYCVVVTLGQINSGCIIEGGLLTQVQTHAMETFGLNTSHNL